MTRDEVENLINQLPAGWKLIGVKRDGTIEVESEKYNIVIRSDNWDFIKQTMTSYMLSHR